MLSLCLYRHHPSLNPRGDRSSGSVSREVGGGRWGEKKHKGYSQCEEGGYKKFILLVSFLSSFGAHEAPCSKAELALL